MFEVLMEKVIEFNNKNNTELSVDYNMAEDLFDIRSPDDWKSNLHIHIDYTYHQQFKFKSELNIKGERGGRVCIKAMTDNCETLAELVMFAMQRYEFYQKIELELE